ncbi:MAG: hypothetical protein GY822_11940, partial [Deltaproteobacteria bacterium]|nr:hypothetical protein [Deltaproteobacteria bacterium]
MTDDFRVLIDYGDAFQSDVHFEVDLEVGDDINIGTSDGNGSNNFQVRLTSGTCGNGTVDAGEGCDDGNTPSGDGCGATCLRENGEGCSAAGECESAVCDTVGSNTCESADTCGNGTVDAGEVCYDGNTTSGDGCGASCELESGYTCVTGPATGPCEDVGPGGTTTTCGDGIQAGLEVCDDG